MHGSDTEMDVRMISTRAFAGNHRYVVAIKYTSTNANMPNLRPIHPKRLLKGRKTNFCDVCADHVR